MTRGLWNSETVYSHQSGVQRTGTNPKGGRGYWPDCWSLVVGGGGIQGGCVVGASDKDEAYVAERPVSIGDLYATVYKPLGIDWTKPYISPIARPVYIANGFNDTAGSPLKELI